jgi:hypothetical protein
VRRPARVADRQQRLRRHDEVSLVAGPLWLVVGSWEFELAGELKRLDHVPDAGSHRAPTVDRALAQCQEA